MEDFSNIVPRMIEQHRTLQNNLAIVLKLTTEEKPNAVNILENINKFSINITDHLLLENGAFYPELIRRMKEKKLDTTQTEIFITEMKTIGDTITAFLKKFGEVSIIETEMVEFRYQLTSIIPILNLRIESEESGVYGVFSIL